MTHNPPIKDTLVGEDVVSLHVLLAAPVTDSAVSAWAGDSAPRHAFLATTVWCRVRWPKHLGIPAADSFAAGFTMVHDYQWTEFADGPGGIRPLYTEWRPPKVAAVLSGSAEDATHYSTSILLHPELAWTNRLRVALAPDAWAPLSILAESGNSSFRYLEPAEQQFKYLGEAVGQPAMLGDVEMVARDIWTW